jgi:branched-chain amino acid transport system ATP-binding protein
MTDPAMRTNGEARTSDAVLELKDIEAGYEGTVVLRNVNVTVPTGSVVALLGPNGAGKSTLLKTASGLVQPMRGQVILRGEDVTRRRPHQRARRGMRHIPEGRAIYRSLSVKDNLVMHAQKGEEGDAIARATSAFPALQSRLAQVAGTMSGGEQQMLAMASAYGRNADLLLVDEPSLGLAPRVVDSIFDFLRQVATSGTSLLVVDQYVSRALDLADRVYVLIRGEIAFEGSPDELRGDEVFQHYLS